MSNKIKLNVNKAFSYTSEQEEAISANKGNILVSAAAGSGKTAVMAERIVRRVVSGELDLDKVLILTFTDAASHDMSKKIEEKLLEYETAALESGNQELTRRIQAQVALLPAAHIETIHAFCLSLIKTFPEEVKGDNEEQILSANFTTADANLSEELQIEALDQALENFYTQAEQNNSSSDEELRAQGEIALQLIQVYSSNRNDDSLRQLLKSLFNDIRATPNYKEMVEHELQALLKRASDFGQSKHIKLLFDGLELRVNSTILSLEEFKRRLANPSLAFVVDSSRNAEYSQSYEDLINFVYAVEESIQSAKISGDYARAWDEIYELKSRVVFEKPRRASIKPGDEIPDLDGSEEASSNDPAIAKAISNQLKNDFIECLSETFADLLVYLHMKGSTATSLTDYCKYEQKRVWTQSISEISNDIKKMHPLISMIFDIILDMDEIYAELKNRRNLIDFADYEHFALQIISSPMGYLYCQGKFQEVYIDEYQDTSSIQETILHGIAPNNTFMVGDVKQSIYRFRNARPEIFLSKANQFQDTTAGEYFVLSKNFRSEAGILDAINDVFSQIMTEDFTGINYNDGHQMNVGLENTRDNNRVEFLINLSTEEDNTYFNVIDDTEQYESRIVNNLSMSKLNPYNTKSWVESNATTKSIFHIASEIIRLNQEEGVALNEITVLTRTNFEADEIVKIFNQIGLANNKEITASVKDNYLLEVQLALLQSLNNSMLDIPLATLMISRLLLEPFNETELLQIRIFQKEAGESGNYYEAVSLLAKANLEPDHEFYALSLKTRRFLERYNYWRLRSSEVAVSTLISEIWNSVDYLDLVIKEEGSLNAEALENFLSEIQKQEVSGQIGLNQVILSLENEVEEKTRIVNDNNFAGDGVNVVTLHKSKGLTLGYVFIFNIDKNLRDKSKSNKIIMNEDLGIGFDAAEINEYAVYTYPSQLRLAIEEDEHRRYITEEICLLYVAISRAKHKVYFSGSLSLTDKYSSLNSLIDLAEAEGNASVSDYIISSLSSYQEFILLALSRHDNYGVQELISYYETEQIEDSQINKNIDSGRYTIKIRDNKADLEQSWAYLLDYMYADTKAKTQVSFAVEAEILPEDLYNYYLFPQEEFAAVPKRTVSEIKRSSMLPSNRDQEEESYVSDVNLELSSISAIREEVTVAGLTAAQLGIYLHSSLRHLNLLALRGANNFEDELDRQLAVLESAQFLSADAIKSVRSFSKQIQAYVDSTLAQTLMMIEETATEEDSTLMIYREMPFTFRYIDAEIGESIVQGVIDLWYKDGEELVLVDYKSDRLPNDDLAARAVLLERYGVQMKIYAQALETSLGETVSKISIWSIRLAREFIFTREELGL